MRCWLLGGRLSKQSGSAGTEWTVGRVQGPTVHWAGARTLVCRSLIPCLQLLFPSRCHFEMTVCPQNIENWSQPVDVGKQQLDNPRLSWLWALACLVSGSTGAQGCLLRLAGRGEASRAGTGWGAAVTAGERQAASGVSSAAPFATYRRPGLLHRETSLPTTSSVKHRGNIQCP